MAVKKRKRPLQGTLQRMDGFTLLEVMISVAILSLGMMVILDSQGGSSISTIYSRKLTTATQLARARLTKLEQEIEDGRATFGLSDSVCKDGRFDEEGRDFEAYSWSFCIKKVELSTPDQIPGLTSPGQTSGDTGQPAAPNPLFGALGVPMSPGSTPDITSALGPFSGLLQGQMKAVFQQLQESLREIQLIVKWKEGSREYDVKVTTHIFHFDEQTGMPNGWPQPTTPGQTP